MRLRKKTKEMIKNDFAGIENMTSTETFCDLLQIERENLYLLGMSIWELMDNGVFRIRYDENRCGSDDLEKLKEAVKKLAETCGELEIVFVVDPLW
jgi:hypothetical protein